MVVPKLHYISQGKTPEAHLSNIQSACSYGAELVQLRLKNVADSVVFETAKKAREITAHYQTRLIINDYYKVAKEVKADGVHLGKTDRCPQEAKDYLGEFYFVGGTANTLQDCEELLKKNVDYIGLGPFRYTSTKENLSPILGAEGYLTILEALNTKTPIIAIGGITINDVEALLKTKVYGVATSGEITTNFNNISKFNALLKSSSTHEQVWKMH